MSQQFNSKYLNDCIDHVLVRCQQVTPIRGHVHQVIGWAFDYSHQTSTGICRDLRKQHKSEVSRFHKLASWERHLLAAANGLLMPQPAMKMNCVLPQCRLAIDELETRFYSTYHPTGLSERDNPDWRYNYSWISQEGDWQREHLHKVPAYVNVK